MPEFNKTKTRIEARFSHETLQTFVEQIADLLTRCAFILNLIKPEIVNAMDPLQRMIFVEDFQRSFIEILMYAEENT